MKKFIFAVLMLASPLVYSQDADHEDKQARLAMVCFSRKMIVIRMAALRDQGMTKEQYDTAYPLPKGWTKEMYKEINDVETYVWSNTTETVMVYADKIYDKCFDDPSLK